MRSARKKSLLPHPKKTREQFVRFSRRVLLLQALLCVVVFSFVVYSNGMRGDVRAASATTTWTGGGDGYSWNDATNWDNGIPDVSTDAVVDNAAVFIAGGVTAVFDTLVVGNGTNSTTVTLVGAINSSSNNITIDNAGILTQADTDTHTIQGVLTVKSGGVLTHGNNSTAHSFELDFSVGTLDVQSGGQVNVDGLGFDGGATQQNGYGTGAGLYLDSINSTNDGNGAGHGGNGGADAGAPFNGSAGDNPTIQGGATYCSVSNPATLGSGGGGGGNSPGTGGNGGGLIILNVSGTATVNGTITADGGDSGGCGFGTSCGGGGAGGGVKLVANTIEGTPQSISVNGGAAGTDGGGGGGGCALIRYTSANSINGDSVLVYGGSSASGGDGGSGLTLVKTGSTNGTLFLDNSGQSSTRSDQVDSSLTLDAMEVDNGAIFTVTSTKTLSFANGAPFAGESPTGTLRVSLGTLSFTGTTITISTTTVEYWQQSTLTNGSNLDITLDTSSTLALHYFTTTTPAEFNSLTLGSTATLTHGQNEDAQSHVVNITADTLTLGSGSYVDLDGRGYEGGGLGSDGSGPSGSFGRFTSGDGTGGAHGGNGGYAESQLIGYTSAYCNITDPGTIGAGGGGGTNNGGQGGDGGGYAKFTISGTATLGGTLTADGASSGCGSSSTCGGGGAGGAFNIVANTIAGTPQSISITGGTSGTEGGGGAGGCLLLTYTATNSVTTSSILVYGGSSSEGQSGGSGIAYIKKSGQDGGMYLNNNENT